MEAEGLLEKINDRGEEWLFVVGVPKSELGEADRELIQKALEDDGVNVEMRFTDFGVMARF